MATSLFPPSACPSATVPLPNEALPLQGGGPGKIAFPAPPSSSLYSSLLRPPQRNAERTKKHLLGVFAALRANSNTRDEKMLSAMMDFMLAASVDSQKNLQVGHGSGHFYLRLDLRCRPVARGQTFANGGWSGLSLNACVWVREPIPRLTFIPSLDIF